MGVFLGETVSANQSCNSGPAPIAYPSTNVRSLPLVGRENSYGPPNLESQGLTRRFGSRRTAKGRGRGRSRRGRRGNRRGRRGRRRGGRGWRRSRRGGRGGRRRSAGSQEKDQEGPRRQGTEAQG